MEVGRASCIVALLASNRVEYVLTLRARTISFRNEVSLTEFELISVDLGCIQNPLQLD